MRMGRGRTVRTSIYDSTGDAPDSSTPDMLDGGIFAELLGEFCIGIGDGLNFLLTSFGCDLNAIIFGRVGGASARTGDVALFFFYRPAQHCGLVGMAMLEFSYGASILILPGWFPLLKWQHIV